MGAPTVIKAVGIILVCLGIHLGLGGIAGLCVFGAGLALIFLP